MNRTWKRFLEISTTVKFILFQAYTSFPRASSVLYFAFCISFVFERRQSVCIYIEEKKDTVKALVLKDSTEEMENYYKSTADVF